MYYTTLNRISEKGPDKEMWEVLLESLGKSCADDEPLSLLHIVESNGIEDAVWALRAIDACPEIRLFAVRCARRVQNVFERGKDISVHDVAGTVVFGDAIEDEIYPYQVKDKNAWFDAFDGATAVARVTAIALGVSKSDPISWIAQKNDYIAIFCKED